MSAKNDGKKAKKTVSVDIQFQVKVYGPEAEHPKTYEYAVDGTLKAREANAGDAMDREMTLLKFLVKALKADAKARRKKLTDKQKQAKKTKKNA